MPYDDDYDVILDDEDDMCDQSHGGLVWDDDDEDDADWHNEHTEEMDDLGEWFTDEGGLTADALDFLAEEDENDRFV